MAVRPISVPPSQSWDGIDGPWSTFAIRAGSPFQTLRVLVSTAVPETWVIDPLGCSDVGGNKDPQCTNARGLLFDNKTSTSWKEVGLYALGVETNLPYTSNFDSGNYGFDTLGLGYTGSGSDEVENMVLATVATSDFYVGLLGINPTSINFTTQNDPSPSLLTILKTTNRIPSLSYGYSAGAQYRLKQVDGTLTLGGTDTSRYTPNDISFSFASDISRDLVVGLQSIKFSDDETKDQEMLPSGGILTFVDSTVPQIWLPLDACQQFEEYFGIEYDNNTDLYLVNASTHSRLLRQNASLSFQLGNDPTSGSSTIINFPYASFDMTVAYPIVNQSTNYFPIRRAANDSQYTLGRAFLQESYLTVDYERRRFAVSQAVFPDNAAQQITPIVSVNGSAVTTTTATPSKKISGGAIAGIVIGIIAIIALIIAGALLYWRRSKHPKSSAKPTSPDLSNELEDSKPLPHGVGELQANGNTEPSHLGDEGAFSPNRKTEMEGTTPLSEKSRVELEGSRGRVEMEGSPKMAHEMPGSATAYEMDAGGHGLSPVWTPRQGPNSSGFESPRSPASPQSFNSGAISPPPRSRYNVSPLASPGSPDRQTEDSTLGADQDRRESPMSPITPGAALSPGSPNGGRTGRSESGRRTKWGFRRRGTGDNPGG